MDLAGAAAFVDGDRGALPVAGAGSVKLHRRVLRCVAQFAASYRSVTDTVVTESAGSLLCNRARRRLPPWRAQTTIPRSATLDRPPLHKHGKPATRRDHPITARSPLAQAAIHRQSRRRSRPTGSWSD